MEVYDAYGLSVSSVPDTYLFPSLTQPWRAVGEFIGWYYAGTILEPEEARFNVAMVRVPHKDFQVGSAAIRLPYSFDLYAAIGGPFQAQPNTTITLTSNVTNAQGTTTYQWRRDGSVVGSGPSLTQSYSLYTSGYKYYSLTVTDGEGDIGTATHRVFVGDGGGSSGGGDCDPGDDDPPNIRRTGGSLDSVQAQQPGSEDPGIVLQPVRPHAEQLPPCEP